MSRPSPPHHRICLLFDLDCFYAQCERVRLGLPPDVCLALLQWNAVLAVTYPARKFGIKRGDSWEAVAEKSNHACWAIHLKILEKKETPTAAVPPPPQVKPKSMQNPYVITPSTPIEPEESTSTTDSMSSSYITPQHVDADPEGCEGEPLVGNIEEAYDQIYRLSLEEQLECQKRERGVQRFYHEGKSCLERYRIASARIFLLVLESLTKHVGGKGNFVLERASIDEFYLDITDYCYEVSKLTMSDMDHQTFVVGEQDKPLNAAPDCPLRTLALQRACQVSHSIRQQVFDTLGLTMSAGISTNKMLAKLAASYGKPNGQAVLYPSNFQSLLNSTKVKSVRHFGGKQGKQVLNVMREQSLEPESFDPYAATMGDLQQIPLPVLQRYFSDETASFIFGACRGVDNEAVRETNGALVKSITAFKSFPATSRVEEIKNWVSLMADEMVVRIVNDSARNHRYPKTCTLNYTYYMTETGQRPNGVASARSFCTTKSTRLSFPHQSKSQKQADLVEQSMEKLLPILKKHPLRGVGLSVSNFESRGCPPEGVKGITTFFKKAETSDLRTKQLHRNRLNASELIPKCEQKVDVGHSFPPETQDMHHNTQLHPQGGQSLLSASTDPLPDSHDTQSLLSNSTLPRLDARPSQSMNQFEMDQEMAMELQATFDRENYVLNPSHRRAHPMTKPVPKRLRTIDSFFGKKA